ncbi:MAG: YceI family protein [Bacteroidota bacterium]
MQNKFFIFTISLLALTLVACGGKKEATVDTADQAAVAEANSTAVEYAVDLGASSLAWTAKKVTGQHNGVVPITEGSFSMENGTVTAGSFTIDMASLKVLDIEDEETNGKLTGHLNSPDFFNTAEFPAASFEVTKAVAVADDSTKTHDISGNLTIKGISKEITFPANVSLTDGTFAAMADFNIDRTEWDIRYGSGKFFEDLGDKTIYDDINLVLNLVAKPATSPTAMR